jgi:hypothetical protein
MTDALRVFEVQRGRLDLQYLQTWSAKLGITDLWNELQQRASPL